ncbi:drug/metabolite transporter (DMT)-like permease [Kitasatospora sp. MAP12-15]|nr:drug/metabolite transporter (DMT)-like permease [Kitasatospora sp. MAP12-44]
MRTMPPALMAWVPAAGTALVAALWGTSGVLVREVQLPAAAIACGRALTGALALGAWQLTPRARQERLAQAVPRGAAGSLVLSGALLAVHWLTFVMALQRFPIGTVLLGIYLAPLLVAAAARPALGERVSGRQWGALALAVAGCSLILHPRAGVGWSGIGLIAFSALAYAGSILASKHALASVPPTQVTLVQLGVVALLLSPVAIWRTSVLSARDLGVIVALGVLYSAAAQLAYLTFLRRLSVTTSSILLFMEPVSALVSGWALLGERPGGATWAGAALVLAAGAAAAQAGKMPEIPGS